MVGRFNGATDLHRWKQKFPIFFYDTCRRFNGATDLHRWKLFYPDLVEARKYVLQWGHRFTSVETQIKDSALLIGDRASMGPPIYIGGNSINPLRRSRVSMASMGPPIYIGGNM